MRAEHFQSNERILALEVRSRDLGFAMFEGSSQLVDYGRRKYRVKGTAFAGAVIKRIVMLMDMHQPSAIVLRERVVNSAKARQRTAATIRIVQREAKKRSIRVHSIRTAVVRRYFALHACESKQQIAAMSARWFPKLAWKVPPERKAWKGEHHRMEIFDAVATAVAFLNRSPPAQ